MKPLVIRVEDVESEDTWVYVLDDSPVVLGRGDGATLRLGRPFVSQAHGTFAYDAQAETWTYVDLDSASGTVGPRGPLAPEQAVALAPNAALVIGSLVLTVLEEAPSERPPDGAASPFALAPRAAGDAAAATVRLSAVAAALRRAHRPQAPAAADPPPGGTTRLPDGWRPSTGAGVAAGGTRLFPDAPPPARARPAQRVRRNVAGAGRSRATLGIAIAVASAAAAGTLVAWRIVSSAAGPGPTEPRFEPAVSAEPEARPRRVQRAVATTTTTTAGDDTAPDAAQAAHRSSSRSAHRGNTSRLNQRASAGRPQHGPSIGVGKARKTRARVANRALILE